MSHDVDEKKKIFDFFKGFLITLVVLIILNLSSFISIHNISMEHRNTLRIVHNYSLLAIIIIISVIVVLTRNKNPYISKGMITAIFGLVSLLIKRNGEQLNDPYKEQRKKKVFHIIFGFLLSIFLLTLYLMLISSIFGTFLSIKLPGSIYLLEVIILSNIYFGVIFFFSKLKLRYISIGMITALLIAIFLVCVFILIFVLLFGVFGVEMIEGWGILLIELLVIGVVSMLVGTRLDN